MTNNSSDQNKTTPENHMDTQDDAQEQEIVTIGKYLKFEREQREVSLKAVSQHTKISLTMLTYLEEEDFENLPDLAYVRGFVKNYSKALGISTVASLEVLEDTYIYLNKQAVDISTNAETLQNPAPIEGTQNTKLIGIIVIAFIAIIVTMTRNDNKPKQVANEGKDNIEATPKATPIKIAKIKKVKPITLSATTPLSKTIPKIVKEEVKEEDKVVAIATATATPEVTATPEATKVAESETATEKEKLAETEKKTEDNEDDEKKKEIKFQTLSRSLYTFKENNEEALKEFMPLSFRESNIENKQNLYITAKGGDTWITYKIDQQPVKKIILRDGRNMMVRGDEITAFLGNVHVAKIFLNNKLLKIVSRSGVKSLIFPQERRDKHKYPLFIYNDDGSVTSSYEYIKAKGLENN